MAKRAYTEMHTALKRHARGRGLSLDHAWYDLTCKLLDSGELEETPRALQRGLAIDYAIETGAALHFFLPGKEFTDWLENCVDEDALSPGHVKTLAGILPPPKSDAWTQDYFARAGCLHFPCGEKSRLVSVGFAPLERECYAGEPENGIPDYSAISLSFSFAAEGSFGTFDVILADAGKLPTEVLRYVKLLVGLGMYLACFPEQAVDGIPQDLRSSRAFDVVKHPVTIGVSEKIVSRDGPCPHYRSGHFVLLSSNRYVNKKGQVVFRHGCFVKGKAKTVLGTDAAEG